jgi:hypothetical protein
VVVVVSKGGVDLGQGEMWVLPMDFLRAPAITVLIRGYYFEG